MGRLTQHRPRASTLFGLGLLLCAAYLGVSIARVGENGPSVIRDCHPFTGQPQQLAPGWHLSPPGLCRLTRISPSSQTVPFDFPQEGATAPVSREGVAARVQGAIVFQVPASSALRFYRFTAGQPAEILLRPILYDDVSEEVRASSFAGISGAHRVELEAGLGRRVGEKLRSLGLVLQSVRVDSVRMAREGASGSIVPLTDSKLLVIGLDGADWRVIDPLMRAGKMPNLSRLARAGVRARLKSLDPILSPVIWTSAATGFLPAEHGILDFLVRDNRTGLEVPVTSRHRKVKAIWNLLSDSGVSVGVIGWWATWPAEYVDGYIVSDRVAYQLFGQRIASSETVQGKTFPPDLYRRILPLVMPPERIGQDDLKEYMRIPVAPGPTFLRDYNDRERELKTVLASTETYRSIAGVLAVNGFQPFEAIYFEGIDTVSHLFMPFRPPRKPGVSDQAFGAYSQAVDTFYIKQDEILGELLAKADPHAGIIVLSDHGFKSENDRPNRESRVNYASAASWHRRYGIFIASGGRFRRSTEMQEVSILDITPTILAYFGLPTGEDMQGRPVSDLFDPEFLRAHPVTYRPSWENQAPPATTVLTADPEGDRAIREKLKSLGYLSSQGDLSSNNLGSALLSEGKVEQAIAEFKRAVAAAPNLGLARTNLARAYLVRGDLPSARGEIQQALRLDSASPEAAMLMAQIEMSQGNASSAERRLKEILQREPSAGPAHRLLGQILQSRGDRKSAEMEFHQALAIDPDDAEAENSLGVLLRDEGHLEESEHHFRRAIEADPSFAGALSNLATSAMDRGDLDEARKLLDRAVKLAPEDAMICNNLGNLLLRRGEWEAAAVQFQRALDLKQRYAEPHNGLGAIHVHRGDDGLAESEFRQAMGIDPKSPDPRINLARLLARKGRREAAERELRAYLLLVPGEKDASLELARMLLEWGRPDDAAQVCAAALPSHPGEVLLWNLKAESCWRGGKIGEAVESFRQSLKINPSQPDIASRLKMALSGEAP